jgi:hypothetical protein
MMADRKEGSQPIGRRPDIVDYDGRLRPFDD